MDDVGQRDLRVHGSGDCTAAECLRAEPSPPEISSAELTTVPVSRRPFAWQSGRRLLLLERELGYWVLAELEFEPEICRYTEVRRAFYRWEREAVGALLSRTIAYGETAAAESADLLETWISHRRSSR